MIPEQNVKVKVGSYTNRYWKEHGFPNCKNGDELEVPIGLIANKCNQYVTVICDYCGKEYMAKYSNLKLHKEVVNKDCCKECSRKKAEESMMITYGVNNISKLPEVREKAVATMLERYGVMYWLDSEENLKAYKETLLRKYGVEFAVHIEGVPEKITKTCLEKYGAKTALANRDVMDRIKQKRLEEYGVAWPTQRKEVMEKQANTNMSRYGYKFAMQSPEIREAAMMTLCKNGSVPTSKQQIAIFDMLKDDGFNVELNYSISSYSLDVALFYGDVKIDIEFDGDYWHQDKNHDNRRDFFMLDNGWKVLRFLGKNKPPSHELLLKEVNKLLNTKVKHQIIDIRQDNNFKEENKNG